MELESEKRLCVAKKLRLPSNDGDDYTTLSNVRKIVSELHLNHITRNNSDVHHYRDPAPDLRSIIAASLGNLVAVRDLGTPRVRQFKPGTVRPPNVSNVRPVQTSFGIPGKLLL